MKIALTGATGFIGRAVLSELRAQGHDVRALVRDQGKLESVGAQCIPGGLADSRALDSLVKDTDAVIHAAGAIKAMNALMFMSVNEVGARRVAEAARRAGIKRFIHISSLAAREPRLSNYAASKRAGEAAVSAVAGDMRLLIIRPPAVYGPGDRATLPLFKSLTSTPAVLIGSSRQRFSLLYVGDLARILAQAAESDRVGIVEVDDGRPDGYCWEDIARIASAQVGRHIQPYFLPRTLCRAAALVSEASAHFVGRPHMLTRGKLRELLHENWIVKGHGWQLEERTGFADGFARTLEWYTQAGWLPRRGQGTIKQANAI
jgi:nucleoside-diphosphate-sugar epimerase